MAFIGKRPVACIGWGSAAWSVKSRDSFVGWNKKTKENNLHFVANNTRFLILPWIAVKCLASKILGLNSRRISNDWLKLYNYPLFLLETFVEKDRFKGTCYKAANWICTGQTKGIAEYDRRTGVKHLRVRGLKAVRFCATLKALGVNIFRAAAVTFYEGINI